MRSPQRTAIAAIAAAATALMLSGCGGPSSAQSPSPTSSTHPAPSSGSTDLGTDPTPDATSDPPSATTSDPAAPATDPSAGGTEPAPGTTAGTTAGGTACSLVTEADIAAVLTVDPGAGRPVSSHGATQCQYGDYQSQFVLVNVTPSQGKASYDHCRNDPHISDGGTVADVSGVGDQAFSIASPMTGSIYFTKGDALVLVMVEIFGAASSPMDQVLTLATLAAGRV
jgi:hypothetical protein